MEAVRKNVTEISQFARERGKPLGGARTPLDDCREVAAVRLAAALEESLALVVEQLVKRAEKAVGMDMYHLYMNSLELARDRGEPISAAFQERYLWHFNQECRRVEGAAASGLKGELSLQEPDDLEETLAASTLANAIFNECSEELFGLDKRIGMLINDPDLVRGNNPVGPETIGTAVMDALEAQSSPIKVRLLIMSLLSRSLPERVRVIYQDINRKLIERNILPTIRVGLKREQAAPSAAAQTGSAAGLAPASADMAGYAGATEAHGGDLLSTLQQMMSGSMATSPAQALKQPFSGGADARILTGAAAGVESSRAIRQPGTFLHALNQIQHGQAEGPALAGIDPSLFMNGRVNTLRDLRGGGMGGMGGMMSPLDSMTLDIVAMVFDYILDDERIPDAIKALIGRLQIPMLKVAMLDKGFFSHKSHPARQLLDGMADAAIGWEAAEGREVALYKKIEQLVDSVLDGFEANLGIFGEALTDLNKFVAQEKHSAEKNVALSALAIKNQEQAELDRRFAHDEVESCMVGRRVPAVIRTFLGTHWELLLASLYRKVGRDSEPWKGALTTMKDLVWSVAPKFDSEDRKRLVGMLPGLLKRLDEGVQCLDMDQIARDAFFSDLVRCHARAVRAGLLDDNESMPLDADADAEADLNDIPILDQRVEFKPVQPVVGAVTPEEVDAMVKETAIEIGEITIRGLEWSTEDLPLQAPTSTLVGLERGSWIAYRQENGEEVRAKLSWVSPLQGIYLFTNRQGERAMSINAMGLAAKIESGEVRRLDDAPLIDRAVNRLMENLQRNAA